MSRKQTTTPSEVSQHSTHSTRTSREIIFGLNNYTEPVSCVRILTPIYNITSENNANLNTTCVRQKFNSLRWTVRKHFLTLFRVHTVHCDAVASTTSTSENEHNNSDTGSPTDVRPFGMGRRYKLLDEEVDEFLENETPMERLRRNFTKDELTRSYPGDIEVMKTVLQGLFFGLSAFGLVKGSKQGYEDFQRRNRFTMYVSSKAMHKRLRNRVGLEAMKEAIKINVRVFRILLPILGLEKFLSIYRNKTSPVHLATGVGVSMGLYKFQQGPKATFAAIVIGGALGLVFGTVHYLLLCSIGNDQERMNRKMVFKLINQKRSYRSPEKLPENEFTDGPQD